MSDTNQTLGNILFRSGASGRKLIVDCPHTHRPYAYHKNEAGIVYRAWVKPGESVDWVETTEDDACWISVAELVKIVNDA